MQARWAKPVVVAFTVQTQSSTGKVDITIRDLQQGFNHWRALWLFIRARFFISTPYILKDVFMFSAVLVGANT